MLVTTVILLRVDDHLPKISDLGRLFFIQRISKNVTFSKESSQSNFNRKLVSVIHTHSRTNQNLDFAE